MAPETIIIWLVIGAIAGWLAGQIMKGGGFGLVGDIVVGIIGSVVAGWLLPRVGLYLGGGFIAEIINAVIGAVVVLFVVRLVVRRAARPTLWRGGARHELPPRFRSAPPGKRQDVDSGGSIPKSLHIFFTSMSLISLCRGTADRLFCRGLCHHE